MLVGRTRPDLRNWCNSAAATTGSRLLVIGGISLAVAAALCSHVTDPAAAASSSPAQRSREELGRVSVSWP